VHVTSKFFDNNSRMTTALHVRCEENTQRFERQLTREASLAQATASSFLLPVKKEPLEEKAVKQQDMEEFGEPGSPYYDLDAKRWIQPDQPLTNGTDLLFSLFCRVFFIVFYF